MHLSTTALLLGGGLLAGAADRTLFAPLGTSPKRDVMSCEQTYGPGSVACGDAAHSMCFNPSQGQTCCAEDHGYCDKGKYCAPVAGYCCLESEDLAECAQEAGFTLPASATPAPTPVVASKPAVVATSSSKPSSSPVGAATKPSNGTTPHVQVSVARKEQWTLVYMTIGIGAVGLIMATF